MLGAITHLLDLTRPEPCATLRAVRSGVQKRTSEAALASCEVLAEMTVNLTALELVRAEVGCADDELSLL